MIWKVALGVFLGIVMSALVIVIAVMLWLEMSDLTEWLRKKRMQRRIRKAIGKRNEIGVDIAPSDNVMREHFDTRA